MVWKCIEFCSMFRFRDTVRGSSESFRSLGALNLGVKAERGVEWCVVEWSGVEWRGEEWDHRPGVW